MSEAVVIMNESTNNAESSKRVVVKNSLSLRQRLGFGRNSKLSSKSKRTALSTVCSFEEAESSEQEAAEAHATLTTTSGTEAFLCPQKEARYLYDQGLQLLESNHFTEATEVLIQALSLTEGSDLEPEILWTLVSHYSQQDDEAEAGTYLTVLKPHVSKLMDEWIQREASLGMMSLLMYHRMWDVALKMSIHLETDDAVLARLYFETASNLTTEKAVPQLEKALSYCHEQEDEPLKQSILQALVQAHAAEQEWTEALSVQESYMESLQAGSGEKALAHHDAAELHIAQGHYEEALSSLNEGLELVDDSSPACTKMLQAKAHTLYKLGDSPQALVIYKSLLTRVKHCPSDAAKIYYTMGRISCKLGEYTLALEYFTHEAKITKSALGKYHYENSRIYHDIARIHDQALGNYEQALKYYNKALKVEQRNLKKQTSSQAKNEISSQIIETQRCMGMIHYKQGEFGKAFTCSFADDVSI